MPRLPSDIRISLKERGGRTHRIELIRQPVGRPHWGSQPGPGLEWLPGKNDNGIGNDIEPLQGDER